MNSAAAAAGNPNDGLGKRATGKQPRGCATLATRLARMGRSMAGKMQRHFTCPTEFTLAVLGGKWKTVILCSLHQRPCRYSELRQLLPALSDKVLTERLRDLMNSGLIVRRKGADRASSSVYALAPRGRLLRRVLRTLYKWGHQNGSKFQVEVGKPLTMLDRNSK